MSDFLVPGNLIEIAFTTHDGVIWNPAKIVRVAHDRIIVDYPGGERQAIPRNPSRYRIPHTVRLADD